MVQYQAELDQAFAALADPTRRNILQRLGYGSATITELAQPLGMSLTGLKKHVQILEEVGLVETEKAGRARRCSLGPHRLEDAQLWIETYRRMLDERLDRFGELLEEVGTDELLEEAGTDGLLGEAGTDELLGEAGTDGLLGEAGTDGLLGEAGTDGLLGEVGTDEFLEEVGTDGLLGEAGTDGLLGEVGTDRLLEEASTEAAAVMAADGESTRKESNK
jgi:DNA-binding transcriptional ArsR family regulator